MTGGGTGTTARSGDYRFFGETLNDVATYDWDMVDHSPKAEGDSPGTDSAASERSVDFDVCERSGLLFVPPYTNSSVLVSPMGVWTKLVLASFFTVFVSVFFQGLQGGFEAYAQTVVFLSFRPSDPMLFSLGAHLFTHSDVSLLVTNGMLFYYLVRRLRPRLQTDLGIAVAFFVYGVVSSLIQGTVLVLIQSEPVAMVGASGGISGLLGLYATLMPKDPILDILPLPVALAAVAGGIWSIGAVILHGPMASDIGHLSHLSGATLGILTGLYLRRQRQADS